MLNYQQIHSNTDTNWYIQVHTTSTEKSFYMTSPSPEALQHGTSAQVIARHIRNDIESGRLQHDQQLTPTSQLAAEWRTSTATVSRAMNQLSEEGIVINRHGAGRLVNHPASRDHPERLRPQVILIGGFAGSGKTELARILAKQTRWAMLDKDTTTRAVVESALDTLGISPHDRESDAYLSTIRPAEYEALLAAVAENAECGVSVIASAPFIRELGDKSWCDRVSATLDSIGADLHVVWVRTNAESMRSYLVRRGAARDAGKLSDWEGYLAQIDLDFTPKVPYRVVENNTDSRPLQQQAAELLSEVQA